MIRCSFVVALSFLLALVSAAQTSTTRTALTRNNTSACSAGSTAAHCGGAFTGMQDANGTVFNPAPGNVSNVDIHSLLYSGSTAKVFTHVMPWWCMTAGSTATGAGSSCQSHIQIGYNSNDTATVAAQVDDMQRRGFDGLAIAYYGRLQFYDQTTLKFRDELEKRCVGSWCPMQYVLMEEQGSFQWTQCPTDGNGSDRTLCIADAINSDLDYMDANYFNTRAYLRVDPQTKQPSETGRPVVLFFICEECFVDPAPNWSQIWAQVRSHSQQLANGNGLFIFRNAPGFAHTETDGAFAWVNWYGSDPYGLNYLANFYNTSVLPQYQHLLTWGAGWKGFNDALASWAPDPPRVMGQQCGNTWLQTFKAAESQYDLTRQLPFISAPTWNDYEEGTEIETGIDNCLSLSASVTGDILSWALNFSSSEGSEETIDHYEIYDSADGENLTLKAALQPGTRSVDLRTLNLASGARQLYIQAVGKPSILNKLSGAVSYAPAPKLTVSPTSLSFGTALVGTTTAAKSVTLTNSGNSDLVIQSIATAGDYAQTHNCPATLAAAAQCQVQVSFKPTNQNSRSGSLLISTNASTTAAKVSLSGTGTYVKLTPTSLTFASQTVNTTSAAQSVTFTNTRTTTLKISSVSVSTHFTRTTSCGSQVAAKASCNFYVKFRPTSKGTKSGNLSISHDGGGSPSRVALSGTGR